MPQVCSRVMQEVERQREKERKKKSMIQALNSYDHRSAALPRRKEYKRSPLTLHRLPTIACSLTKPVVIMHCFVTLAFHKEICLRVWDRTEE